MFVIEIHNEKAKDQYTYIHYDEQSGGYPYVSCGMFTAVRFKTFDEARNEYQRMITANLSKMSDGSLDLPYLLRSAGGINGVGNNDAKITTSILEVSGCTWPTLKVERLVQHTLVLHEDKFNASIQIVDCDGVDGA